MKMEMSCYNWDTFYLGWLSVMATVGLIAKLFQLVFMEKFK